jgi:hypothetical protein
VTVDAGALKVLHVTFEHHCEGTAPAVTGCLRWTL